MGADFLTLLRRIDRVHPNGDLRDQQWQRRHPHVAGDPRAGSSAVI
jgi:hypothetical protein